MLHFFCISTTQHVMLTVPLCRMGNVVPFTVVEGPEAWTAADYTNQDDYIYHFSPVDLAELETVVAGALQQGKDIKVLIRS